MISFHHQNIKNYKSSRLSFERLLITLSLFCFTSVLHGQEFLPVAADDSLHVTDSMIVADSLVQFTDSIVVDSALVISKAKKPLLEGEITYTSEDSLIFSIGQEKVYLFKSGTVNYPVQDIGLTGDYIEFNYSTKIVLAAGAIDDSSGQLTGKPVFTQGDDKYDSDTLRYNFDTRKGMISNIITEQGEGFLHSARTKRLANGEIHVSKGKYTTCDAPHPHFYIALTKAIAIPKDKILSGPAYLVFEDIPMPLGLPFGFFPNSDKRASGFIIPEFRDEQRRGFGLENGGWYLALNDHVDFSLIGSLFSRGTWGVNLISDYLVRYKYRGGFKALFFYNRINDDPKFVPTKDFKITWSHSQDAKANPTRTFKANVDFSTRSFEQRQSTSFDNILENQKNSSISYAKNWPGRPFNFSANLNGSQSTRTRQVNLTLPSINFNMSSVYPFRGKKNDGDYNWFQNIKVSYSSKLENKIKNAPDSTLFTRNTLKHMQSGFSHAVSTNLDNIRLFKIISINPSVSYSGNLYPSYIRKRVLADTSLYRSNAVVIDTIHKITYAHGFRTSLSISASPKLYGMFESTRPNSYIIAVRHQLSPSASFSYTPDMSKFVPNYYREVVSPASVLQPVKYSKYSVYEGQLYSPPSASRESGSLSLALKNNLEMKVRSKSDTTGQGKKVVILDNLDFSANYNPWAASYKWSPMSVRGSTSLFNKKMQLNFSSTFDPYALDSTGAKTNKFLIRETGKLFRITNANLDIGFRLQSSGGDKKEGTAVREGTESPYEAPGGYDEYEASAGAIPGEYVDFDVRWSLNVDYSWSYSRPGAEAATFNHTIWVSGDMNLTPKWKVGLNTNYDMIAREFSATNISIYRDLHCWEMRFGIVPFGAYKSYSFTISAKSSLLHDLKWDKRKSWKDNF